MTALLIILGCALGNTVVGIIVEDFIGGDVEQVRKAQVFFLFAAIGVILAANGQAVFA